MMPTVLQELVAKGQAQFFTYVGSGGQMILDVPDDKGIVIYHMRLHSFCDLDSDQTFEDTEAVVKTSWHQLRVIGKKGTSTFHVRHELHTVDKYLLPKGWIDFETFINQEESVEFELTHYPLDGVSIDAGTLPANIKKPFIQQPPAGYGRTGVNNPAAPIATMKRLYQDPMFEYRAFGKRADQTPGINYSGAFLQWPVNQTQTALNPPMPGIQYGVYTIPVLEVFYCMINKSVTDTFSPPGQ